MKKEGVGLIYLGFMIGVIMTGLLFLFLPPDDFRTTEEQPLSEFSEDDPEISDNQKIDENTTSENLTTVPQSIAIVENYWYFKAAGDFENYSEVNISINKDLCEITHQSETEIEYECKERTKEMGKGIEKKVNET